MSADLVVFGEDWGAHASSSQHLVRRLAQSRRVMWINSIGMRRPRLDARDLHRAFGKAVAMLRRSQSGDSGPAAAAQPAHPEGLSVHSVMAVPAPGSNAAFAVNRALLRRQVRNLMEARGLSKPVLWTSLPTALPAVGELGERAVVYYCGDDFGALAGVDHAPVLEMERDLVERADLVIVASEALAAKFPSAKTILVPHGADIGMFSRPAAPASELEGLRPCAGFYGSISEWIDIALLAGVAERLSHWNFVLVGPVQTDVAPLARLPNVSFLPPQPHSRLPEFVQHWNVSLIPFRDCAQIRACNPLKLREYMAAGTPIASTDFPALTPYRDIVYVGDGVDGMCSAILSAAKDGGRRPERMRRVAGETWESRAADVGAAIDAL